MPPRSDDTASRYVRFVCGAKLVSDTDTWRMDLLSVHFYTNLVGTLTSESRGSVKTSSDDFFTASDMWLECGPVIQVLTIGRMFVLEKFREF